MSGLSMIAKRMKRSALQASKYLGAFRVVAHSQWRRHRLTILCYHGVSLIDEHEWNPSYYLSASVFEDRMRLLRRGGYHVVSLKNGLQHLREGTLPEASVAVTFDDGMYDFYARAYPILAQYEIPATVYLTTYYSEFNRPVFGVFCAYLLWKGREKSLELGRLIPQAGAVDLRDPRKRRRAHQSIIDHVTRAGASARDKDALAARLAGELGVDYDAMIRERILHVMSRPEVIELAGKGVDFQLHTHRHRTPLNRELFLREIDDNRRHIRELLGYDASHFCYPSGMYRRQFLPWLREAGVESATTCDTGMADSHSEPLLLPRIVDGGQLSPIEIEGWLSGASAFLPRRSRSWSYEDEGDYA
jgi:peptidoglycan/xylan/chitin deacetylase (PgdA/CDA1 family)